MINAHDEGNSKHTSQEANLIKLSGYFLNKHGQDSGGKIHLKILLGWSEN